MGIMKNSVAIFFAVVLLVGDGLAAWNNLGYIHNLGKGVKCDDDIKENYLGSQNEKYRDCPDARFEGDICVAPKIGGGNVAFKCTAVEVGVWQLADPQDASAYRL